MGKADWGGGKGVGQLFKGRDSAVYTDMKSRCDLELTECQLYVGYSWMKR